MRPLPITPATRHYGRGTIFAAATALTSISAKGRAPFASGRVSSQERSPSWPGARVLLAPVYDWFTEGLSLSSASFVDGASSLANTAVSAILDALIR